MPAMYPQYPQPFYPPQQYPSQQSQYSGQYPAQQGGMLALGQAPSVPVSYPMPQQVQQPQHDPRIPQLEQALARLEMQLRGLQGGLAAPAMRVKFPSEYIAGKVDYPDLVSHAFFWGVYEMTEGTQGNQPFATTLGTSTFVLNLDLIYSYIKRIHFYMFRQQAPNGDEAPPMIVGDYIPLSSRLTYTLGPTDRWQSFPFEFRLTSGSNQEQWQTNWIPSAILDHTNQEGWQLPTEYKAYTKDNLQIEARPLRTRVQGETENEIVRLFVGFSGYKLYQEKIS